MNNNTSNNFCKKYVYKYVECLNLNYSVFGRNGITMCDHIKEVLENTNCNIKKEFNMNLIDIEKKVYESLPSPTSSN